MAGTPGTHGTRNPRRPDMRTGTRSADRGLAAAQQSGNVVVTGSPFRSVAHCLLSNGRFDAAVQLVGDAGEHLRPSLREATPEFVSVYGTLFLAGSMASARADDRATTRTFLEEAGRAAAQLGTDANHVWTAFGPEDFKSSETVMML